MWERVSGKASVKAGCFIVNDFVVVLCDDVDAFDRPAQKKDLLLVVAVMESLL